MSDMVMFEQTAMLDLAGREFNQMWVDEKAPLFVANNPLHWKAHKLQIALARMEKQQQSNPAQFNSTVYMSTLDKLAELMEQINEKEVKKSHEVLDAPDMGHERAGSTEASEVGARASLSLDIGVSPDNPFSR